MERRTRRRYSRYFKRDAVKLVSEGGCKISESVRSLGGDAKMLDDCKESVISSLRVSTLFSPGPMLKENRPAFA